MKPEDRIEVFSPFAPADCVSRLRGAIDGGVMVSLFGVGSKPVIGKVSESSLRLRRRIRYGNSFQTFLTATMRPEPGGTVISGACTMHPLVRIFNVVWFAIVALFGGTLLLATGWNALYGNGGPSRETLWGILIPLVLLSFGIGLVRLGRYLARDDPQFLMDFLAQILEARPNTPASPR
jgi:hypothetical protein